MAKDGTIAGAAHPLLANTFSFSGLAGGTTTLDNSHVNSYIQVAAASGNNIFRLPPATSVAAGAYIWIALGTLGAGQVTMAPATGGDTLNFDLAVDDNATRDDNSGFFCVRTPDALGTQFGTSGNNWNLIRIHNAPVA